MSTQPESIRAAIIVAHPDDEILWAGGMLLSHPEYRWFIACLCRKSDPDRSVKFLKILKRLHAGGGMSDLEDGPNQSPLEISIIQDEILRLLPQPSFDLILTHAPSGEYTRHRRHEEVSQAVMDLWIRGRLSALHLGLFAYQDEHGSRLPEAIPTADFVHSLPPQLHEAKLNLITNVYGFHPTSWEARTTPSQEAFWFFDSPNELKAWLQDKGEL